MADDGRGLAVDLPVVLGLSLERQDVARGLELRERAGLVVGVERPGEAHLLQVTLEAPKRLLREVPALPVSRAARADETDLEVVLPLHRLGSAATHDGDEVVTGSEVVAATGVLADRIEIDDHDALSFDTIKRPSSILPLSVLK